MQVRGPKIRPMVVSVDRRGRRLLAVAALLGLLLAAAAGGYWYGRGEAIDALAGAAILNGVAPGADARTLVEGMLDQNAALRDELAVYRGGTEMSRQVEEQVRVENGRLQEQVAGLERALAYYRRVAVPDRGGQGLRIEQMTVVPAVSGQGWVLRFLLVRTGETDGAVEGMLQGSVVVQGSSGRVAVPLARMLATGQDRFRVRYVEERQVPLQLPAGTAPLRVDLVAQTLAPQAARVEKIWQRQ